MYTQTSAVTKKGEFLPYETSTEGDTLFKKL